MKTPSYALAKCDFKTKISFCVKHFVEEESKVANEGAEDSYLGTTRI